MDAFTKKDLEQQNCHLLFTLEEIFMQYFGIAGPRVLKREMEKAKLCMFIEATDEEKLMFIEQVLDGAFSDFMSDAKLKIIRSELIDTLKVSNEAKTRFYSHNHASMETKDKNAD